MSKRFLWSNFFRSWKTALQSPAQETNDCPLKLRVKPSQVGLPLLAGMNLCEAENKKEDQPREPINQTRVTRLLLLAMKDKLT